MSRSLTLSHTALKRAVAVVALALTGFAGAFYHHQNSRAGVGGEISIVKALWLANTIFWWFALPLLMLLDRRLSRAAHRAVLLFTVSMLLRGTVEMFMIYVAFNWHCYYGMTHDVATLALLLVCAARLGGGDALDRTVKLHLRFLAVMLGFETYFAWAFHHQIRLAHPELYFVPENWAEFGSILWPTATALAVIAVYAGPFVRRWLGPSTSTSTSTLVEHDLLKNFAAVGRLRE